VAGAGTLENDKHGGTHADMEYGKLIYIVCVSACLSDGIHKTRYEAIYSK
jgi:hypothetical protein